MRVRGWAVGLAVMAGSLVMVAGPAAAVDPVPAPPSGDVRFDWDAARAQMRTRQAASRLPGTPLSGATRGGSVGTRIAGTSRSVVQSVETGTASVTSTAAGTASKFGTVARGAGTVLTAAFALDLSYSAFTGGFGDGFGFGGLIGYESEGLFCDLKSVVTGTDHSCYVSGAAEYVLNSDVGAAMPPGWAKNWRDNGVFVVTYGEVVLTSQLDGRIEVTMRQGAERYDGLTTGTVSANSLTGYMVPVGNQTEAAKVTMGSFTWNPSAVGHLGTSTTSKVLSAGQVPWMIRNSLDAAIVWYAPTNPLRPAEVVPDPVRWWSTTWLCEGGTPQSAQSVTWRETDPGWPDPVEPSCDGSALASVKVTEEGTGLEPWVLYDWTLPAELSAWAEAYPECTGGGCLLELHYVEPVSGTRLACFDNPELCLGWFEAPLKVDTYVCTYGTHDVALAECNMYAPTFDPARWPASGAAPYGDPETGELGPVAVVDPVKAPTDGCPPPVSLTALLNPWWHYKGIICALKAGFVPSAQAVVAGRGAMDQAYSASAVGDVRGLFGALGAVRWSGACGVIYSTEIEAFGGRVMELDTCGPPWSSAGPLRALVGLAFIIGTTVAIVKMMVRALGLKSLAVSAGKAASDGD